MYNLWRSFANGLVSKSDRFAGWKYPLYSVTYVRTKKSKAKLKKWRQKWIKEDNEIVNAREISAHSFINHFREDPTSVHLQGGEILTGTVLGARDPRFQMVDFGLRSEVAFPKEELMGVTQVGSTVGFPIISHEDSFKEAEMDYSRATLLPTVVAERAKLLAELAKDKTPIRFVRGRVVNKSLSGYTVRVLGHDMFLPGTHALGINTPILGEYSTFAVLALKAEVASPSGSRNSTYSGPSSGSGVVRFDGIVSSFVSSVVILHNLVNDPEQWKASGGGSDEERLGYFRMLLAIMFKKSGSFRNSFYLTLRSGYSQTDREGAFVEQLREVHSDILKAKHEQLSMSDVLNSYPFAKSQPGKGDDETTDMSDFRDLEIYPELNENPATPTNEDDK
mmetsp:Transcript_1412/g.2568  ORF Transcript_1412/g.2568 Transcript_1412/m.2568 type:complete len:392 (-) Transcript_1412:151-1326(-)